MLNVSIVLEQVQVCATPAPPLFLLQQDWCPVVDAVKNVELSIHRRFSDELLQKIVISSLLELHARDVVHVAEELGRTALAQFFIREVDFYGAEFSLISRIFLQFECVPRELTEKEVEDDIADCNEVVAAAQFVAPVRIGGGVGVCSDAALFDRERDVLSRVNVNVRAGNVVIDDVQRVRMKSKAHHQIFRLDVPVYKSLHVQTLHAGEQLMEQHQRRLQAEPSVAKSVQLI